ncbi:hypothetical protein OS493_032835 [Desmophyllum pertusum]|uniref:OTU domain-containing protein n=1 Tax=Desmophyllum pertusum TaxID=174260 RepID=A0A9W9YVP8_9CNID|nr:hypothetical protein OS493_032835 [Desmophyllum pertusum]
MYVLLTDSCVDCQSSTQRKGGSSLPSTTQATQKMEFRTGEHHAAMSIIHDLQQIQCDTDKATEKRERNQHVRQRTAENLSEISQGFPNLARWNRPVQLVHGYPSWGDYLQSMEKDGTWGDHLILHAAANCYKTRIHVISSLDREVIISPLDHLVATHQPTCVGTHSRENTTWSLNQDKVTVEDLMS